MTTRTVEPNGATNVIARSDCPVASPHADYA